MCRKTSCVHVKPTSFRNFLCNPTWFSFGFIGSFGLMVLMWFNQIQSVSVSFKMNLRRPVFLAADNPHATPFLIHILVAVAEHERNMISTRTKAALDAARNRGVKFGNPRYEEAIPKANKAWKKLAAERNTELLRIVKETMEVTGLTKLAEIANALNLRGIKTNRGCEFTATQVYRLLN